MQVTIKNLTTTTEHLTASKNDLIATTKVMNATIHDLKTKDIAKTNQIAKLNDVISKTQHMEFGVVDCNSNSDNWPHRDSFYEWITKTVTFTSVYDTPPVIHIGLAEFNSRFRITPDYNSYTGSMASITLVSVNKTSFTFMCKTFQEYNSRNVFSTLMSANWISVYNPSKI